MPVGFRTNLLTPTLPNPPHSYPFLLNRLWELDRNNSRVAWSVDFSFCFFFISFLFIFFPFLSFPLQRHDRKCVFESNDCYISRRGFERFTVFLFIFFFNFSFFSFLEWKSFIRRGVNAKTKRTTRNYFDVCAATVKSNQSRIDLIYKLKISYKFRKIS